jgi:hypothetical protein
MNYMIPFYGIYINSRRFYLFILAFTVVSLHQRPLQFQERKVRIIYSYYKKEADGCEGNIPRKQHVSFLCGWECLILHKSIFSSWLFLAQPWTLSSCSRIMNSRRLKLVCCCCLVSRSVSLLYNIAINKIYIMMIYYILKV